MRRARLQRAVRTLLPAAALLAAPAAAGSVEDLLSALRGTWRGTGVVMGMEARAEMTWSLVLGDRFARLEFENAMTPAEGEARMFAGHGYYSMTPSATAAGRWFDSRGYALGLAIERRGDALLVDWGSEETESGRTTYTLVAPDELDVVDEVRREGELHEFGRVRYRRAPDS